MANVANGYVDITLGSPNPSSPTYAPMPRPGCRLCLRPREEHQEDKCLFSTTTYVPEDLASFRSRFGAWSSGQRIEDCLAEIVFYLGSLPK